MFATLLALGGISGSTVGAPLLTVQAAGEVTVAAKEYTTQGGIANMGSGTANITIKGNAGQTLIGKKFHVYKLFLAQNAQGMESINYTFNPAYEQALKMWHQRHCLFRWMRSRNIWSLTTSSL